MASALATAVKMDVVASSSHQAPTGSPPGAGLLAPSAGLRVPAAPSGRHGHPPAPYPPRPPRLGGVLAGTEGARRGKASDGCLTENGVTVL